MPGKLLINGIETDNEDLEFDCIGAGKTIKFKRDGVEVASIGDGGFPVDGIGYGQSWQDVFSSRSPATNYTNTTGKPIMISVGAAVGYGSYYFRILATIDGVLVVIAQSSNNTGNTSTGGTVIVPKDAVYSISSSAYNLIDYWAELK